jgi:solute carrier family 41
MRTIDELVIIIPVILNLKGNLEMNLSARLGTAANVGQLDDPETRSRIIYGNLSLLQVQAAGVSSVAACVSFILGLIVPKISSQPGPLSPSNLPVSTNATLRLLSRLPRPPLPINDGRPKSGFVEFVMVASTSMSAACLSSLILGSFMCGLIILCRRFGRDPGMILPPISCQTKH